MMKKTVWTISGVALILMGLLFMVNAQGLVVIALDMGSPTFVSSTPYDKSIAYLPPSFNVDRTYSCKVQDSVSGIAAVEYTDNWIQANYGDGFAVNLALTSGTSNDGSWSGTWTPAQLGDYVVGQDYVFSFTAYDYAGNLKVLSGTFKIYVTSLGDWYVNNVKVTSPTQIIYLQTRTVDFKFVKTSSSVPDANWIVTASWPSETLTLANSAPGVWTGQKVFSVDGRYNVDLKASDGVIIIQMSIYDLQIGNTILPVELNYVYGSILIVSGIMSVLHGRRKAS